MRVRHGQIWTVVLDPTVANEQRGVRPCVVASNDRFNSLPIEQAYVVPLTSRDRGLPHHVPIVDDGGLQRPSWAMCEALRAASTHRFGRLVATADSSTMATIRRQLQDWLDPT